MEEGKMKEYTQRRMDDYCENIRTMMEEKKTTQLKTYKVIDIRLKGTNKTEIKPARLKRQISTDFVLNRAF